MMNPVSIARATCLCPWNRLIDSAEIRPQEGVGADHNEQHEDDRVERRLGDVQPDDRAADGPDIGDRRHGQGRAQVCPHAPEVGHRARRRAEDRATLFGEQLRGSRGWDPDEQRS